MKTDYSKKENRIKAINKIEERFIKEFREAGIELYENVTCSIWEHSIEIGIKKGKFASITSTINLCPKHVLFGRLRQAEMNFGSSGSFTPKDKTAYWRTVTAASILKNWQKSMSIIQRYCKIYAKLVQVITKQLN